MRKPSAARTRLPRPAKSPAPGHKRAALQTAGPGEDTPYHHGALRDALLEAAERVLERDGLTGLTLRAVAREAGVSHAAPTHHFGDLTGLVSELAAIGFRRFSAAQAAAFATATHPNERGMAAAKAYLDYARSHPGLYGLMFRNERLDMTRPALREAADASFAGFANAIGSYRNEKISRESLTLEQAADIARSWSLIHGFSSLLIDGRLNGMLRCLPEGTDADSLLTAMLMSTLRRPAGP